MIIDDPHTWTMPFGAHKGRSLAAVPAGYLLWLLEQGFIDQWLDEDALAARRREGHPVADYPDLSARYQALAGWLLDNEDEIAEGLHPAAS